MTKQRQEYHLLRWQLLLALACLLPAVSLGQEVQVEDWSEQQVPPVNINETDSASPTYPVKTFAPTPTPAPVSTTSVEAFYQDSPSINSTANQSIHIATLYDLTSFSGWPEHILNFTIGLINNKTDGWHDNVLTDGSVLSYSINDSACNPDMATRSYLSMMRAGIRPHAIFGCRCSGASMAVARLCDVEDIPILSPASTSVKLSAKEEYSTFSRLVGPDNHMGQVGALISLLRQFGWSRISIINTDTQFTKDIALELSDAWKGRHPGDDPFVGEIAYTDTIRLNGGQIDEDSARRVLNAVPVHKRAINSRVIVLFAHNQHAFPILKLARSMGFQPDTIWIGTGGWVGRDPLDGDWSWMPPIPGYIGIGPYRNQTSAPYLDFLRRLQDYERDNFIQPMTEHLVDYVADRFVDGPLALAKAFETLPLEQRQNGTAVSIALRKVQFEGLSGPIAFEENGDFKDPRYLVLTMSSRGEGWLPIGFATPSHADIAIHKVCYAQIGCTTSIPEDTYPPDDERIPFWIWVITALLIVIAVLLFHQRQKSISVAAKLTRIEHELAELEDNDDAVKQKKGRLYKEIATLLDQPTPEHWTPNPRGKNCMVVDVTPLEEEYWSVLNKLRETMTEGETCHLSNLTRIQNEGIWSYYVFRKNQMANKYGVDLNNTDMLEEASVWHGTSSLNPDVIYRDQQDGFMMQLSQQGHWGRGIYFSERSGYSDPYAFKPLTEYQDHPQPDRELFLVKLLVGEAILLDRTEGEWMAEACKALVTPPDNPNFNGYKFDTVAGIVEDEAKTKVYVVYENGRAYPEYLVRYYKGDRDPDRTPFESWDDVMAEKENQEQEQPVETEASVAFRQLAAVSSKFMESSKLSTGIESSRHVSLLGEGTEEDEADSENSEIEPKGIWQYQDDNEKWVNYLNGHQIQLETAYQQDNTGVTTIETFPWTYAVDFSVNLQTNLDHPERRTRKVRRIHIDHMDASHRNPLQSSVFRFSSRCTASKRRLLHPEALMEGVIEEEDPDASAMFDESKELTNEELNASATASATTGATSDNTTASSANPAVNEQSSPRGSSPPEAAPTTDLRAENETSFRIGGNEGLSSLESIDESFRLAIRDPADVAAGTGTDVPNLRSAMSDEQAASIASSLASLYPSAASIRSVMTDSNSSLYPSFRDVAACSLRGSLTDAPVTRPNHPSRLGGSERSSTQSAPATVGAVSVSGTGVKPETRVGAFAAHQDDARLAARLALEGEKEEEGNQ